MRCPSCNRIASSFLRNAFTLQGVSVTQSAKGYFKCQNCGALLRITSYGKTFWYYFVGAIVLLAIFVLLYRRFISLFGPDAIAIIWILILLFLVFIFTFGLWKHSKVEKVDDSAQK